MAFRTARRHDVRGERVLEVASPSCNCMGPREQARRAPGSVTSCTPPFMSATRGQRCITLSIKCCLLSSISLFNQLSERPRVSGRSIKTVQAIGKGEYL